jgi:hypothetical protein
VVANLAEEWDKPDFTLEQKQTAIAQTLSAVILHSGGRGVRFHPDQITPSSAKNDQHPGADTQIAASRPVAELPLLEINATAPRAAAPAVNAPGERPYDSMPGRRRPGFSEQKTQTDRRLGSLSRLRATGPRGDKFLRKRQSASGSPLC